MVCPWHRVYLHLLIPSVQGSIEGTRVVGEDTGGPQEAAQAGSSVTPTLTWSDNKNDKLNASYKWEHGNLSQNIAKSKPAARCPRTASPWNEYETGSMLKCQFIIAY